MTIHIPTWVDGVLTPVEKLEAHRLGLRHKAVSVFVMRGDAVLMQRRAMGKYHTPGLWANTCCTHPAWEETSLDCANRRLKEELGITGLSPEYRDRVEYRADVGGGLIEHEVVDIFLAHATDDLRVDPDPAEVMETKWLKFDDLLDGVRARPSHFTPWLRVYMDTYAERIFGSSITARV